MRDIEFCSICKSFDAGRYFFKQFVCNNCIRQGKADLIQTPVAPPSKPVREPKQPKPIREPRQPKPVKEPRQPKPIVNSPVKEKRILERKILSFLQNYPDKVFTTAELWDNQEVSFINRRSFNNLLRNLAKKDLLYARSIYSNGHRVYNIYGLSEVEILKPHGIETANKIISLVAEKAPLTTQQLCTILNHSDRNITKIVRYKLTNYIQIWRCENKFYYVQRNNENQINELLKINPKVKQLN